MNETNHKYTPAQNDIRAAAAEAYKVLRNAMLALEIAIEKGAVFRLIFESDSQPTSFRNTAPSQELLLKQRQLISMINDIHFRNDDDVRATNYYGVVGLTSHGMELVRLVNNAKRAFKDAMPNERARIGGAALNRVLLREFAPNEKRINLQALYRVLPEVPVEHDKTRGPLECISFSPGTKSYKAEKIDYERAYSLAKAHAIEKGLDIESVLSKLPSDDDSGRKRITLYDKRARNQGNIQMMYADPSTGKRIQKVKPVAMPAFYDAQVMDSVKIIRTRQQKNKASGKGEFNGNRLLIDLGLNALCLAAPDRLVDKINDSIDSNRPF